MPPVHQHVSPFVDALLNQPLNASFALLWLSQAPSQLPLPTRILRLETAAASAMESENQPFASPTVTARDAAKHRLSGTPESALTHGMDDLFFVSVGKDKYRVFRAALALGSLAVRRRPRVYILGGSRCPDKTDSPYSGMIDDGIDGIRGAVYQIHHAFGQAGLFQ